MAIFYKRLHQSLLDTDDIPIFLLVDNKSLFDAVKTTILVMKNRLMVDLAAVREAIERKEIHIRWVSTTELLVNVLTKAGASKLKLMNVISTGWLELSSLKKLDGSLRFNLIFLE